MITFVLFLFAYYSFYSLSPFRLLSFFYSYSFDFIALSSFITLCCSDLTRIQTDHMQVFNAFSSLVHVCCCCCWTLAVTMQLWTIHMDRCSISSHIAALRTSFLLSFNFYSVGKCFFFYRFLLLILDVVFIYFSLPFYLFLFPPHPLFNAQFSYRYIYICVQRI